MIAALKPYEEYKETGLPWAPVVPKHWKTRRSKVLFRERVQKGFPDEPLLAATQSKGVVRKEDYGERTVTVTKDFHLLKLVEKGDFVISLRSFEGGIEISHTRGIISPAYTVLAARDEAKNSFFKHFFKSRDFIQSLTLFVTGIREGQNIDYERLSRAELPLPTDQEQELIGRFLDHAHGRIDRAIRAKRKVIALLNEQMQAIIHKAVTRGLNPDVPLKPSRISWLGDIPAHWKTLRLRFCVKGKLAYGANEAAEFDNPDWPRYLRITDFGIDGTLKPDTFRSLPPHLAKDYPVNDGDILFARSGATVGKAFLVRIDTANACYAGYLIRARPRPDVVLPEFLFAYTQSLAFTQWKDEIFSKATIQNIGADKYSNLIVPIPKVEEQKSILAHIAVEARPIKTAIARTESEIKLLREYRTRLTADVVTGKLDVREAAKSLPAESPEDISGSPLDSTDLESDLAEEEELEEVEG